MLELRKGLEFMCFIDGECVAHDVTNPIPGPSQASQVDRCHKSQLGLNTFQYNSSGSYDHSVRVEILIKIYLPSLF